MFRKKNKSAIPDFWLEDGPMPADSKSFISSEDGLDGSIDAMQVRERLSGMRTRQPTQQSTPRQHQDSIEKPQLARPIPVSQPAEQANPAKSSLISSWKNRNKSKQSNNDRLRYAGSHRPNFPEQKQTSPAARYQAQPNQAVKPRANKKPAHVAISVSLPNVRLPKIQWKKLWYKVADNFPLLSRKQWAVGLGVVIIVGGAIGTGVMFSGGGKGNTGTKDVASATTKGINFKPLVPSTVNGTSDKAALKINQEKQTVSFQDTFAQTQIVVTEQNLPDKLRNDPGAYIAMLSGFGMDPTKGVDTVIGKLYLSTKTNPSGSKQQFAVIKLNDSLLFISAKRELSAETWKDYLSTLHVARD